MNLTPYIIVRSPSLENLADAVNEWIAKGYVPIGGPFPACINSFAQAVMLREPPRSHHKKKP